QGCVPASPEPGGSDAWRVQRGQWSKKALTAHEKFLHELALALGMTVSELRGRLSYSEYLDWQAYLEEVGPANTALRIEWSIARAIAPFLKDITPRDFAVWPKEPARTASPEEVAALLT